MKAFVDSIAVLGPGMNGWVAAKPVLAGVLPYEPAPMAAPVPALLPAVERRRTGMTVKLALAVGHAALDAAGKPVDSVATVFVSSGNDGDVINDICLTLAGPDRQVSPTRFHNSVHNAPAGYWGIATHSHHPSTSLCAYDWSFAVGLIEAVSQVQFEREHVLLISYDAPYPEPLGGVRRLTAPFGVGLLLGRSRSAQSIAHLDLDLGTAATDISRMRDPLLEGLRQGNPCAHALPLLEAIAVAKPLAVVLERDARQMLTIAVQPL
jgi:hypothetical protein